jgi:hypothetical protein
MKSWVLMTAVAAAAYAGLQAGGGHWAESFAVERTDLGPTGGNPYMPLEPGYVLNLRDGRDTLTLTVLANTRRVDGVTVAILEERETKAGALAEVSRNYLAADRRTGDVYYFGEAVDIYSHGRVVGHEGAWLAGEQGARFGLLMPSKPTVGQRFYQEMAPRVAMDRVEVVETDATVTTLAGTFEHCLHLRETSPLERGASHKYYAPGVGLIKDDGFVLVRRP